MSCSEFSLKESSGLLSIVQLSKFFVLSFTTALIDYHIFCRLSTTFFIFVVSAMCTRSKQLIQNIMFIDICQQLFSFHIFRIFVCASWTAVLLSPVSRDSLYNIAQQSHHCQQLFHLFHFCLHYIASIRYSKPVSFINSIYGIGLKNSGEYTPDSFHIPRPINSIESAAPKPVCAVTACECHRFMEAWLSNGW